MIGGIDIVIPGAPTPADLDQLLRVARARWPSARVEDALTDAAPITVVEALRCDRVPDEFFVYRDVDSELAWITEGANEPHLDHVVHVVTSEDALALVIHQRGGEAEALITEFLEARRHLPHHLRAA